MVIENTILTSNTVCTKKKNTVAFMKQICKERGLKVSGKKEDLRRRIEEYDVKCKASSRIQALWKGKRLRNWLPYQGNILGILSSRCTNTCDFKTLDDLDEIPIDKRFSYIDKDGFQYGFHIDSFIEILKRSNTVSKNDPPYESKHIILKNKALNPYDRKEIPDSVIKRAICLYNHTNKVCQKNIKCEEDVKLNNSETVMDFARQVEQYAIETFQRIDEHGHYTDYKWFWNIPNSLIYRFKSEIYDVFNFRAGISPEIKRNIIPPHGSIEHLFMNTTRSYSKYFKSINLLKQLENQKGICRVVITVQNDDPVYFFNPSDTTFSSEPFFDHTFIMSNINDSKCISNFLESYDIPLSSKECICRTLSPYIARHKQLERITNRNYLEFIYAFLEAINTLISGGIDNDSQALGCIYVLGSLTIVSPDAANALPWLWQSFY